jgi:hypothetical protein
MRLDDTIAASDRSELPTAAQIMIVDAGMMRVRRGDDFLAE